MAELRNVITAFGAKKSENDRIKKAAAFLDIGMSELMRTTVMKEVVKIEKKMEGV